MQPGGVPLDLNCAFAGTDSLLDALEGIPDPRHRRGIRHRQDSMLALAVCGVLSGARSVATLGEWAQELPREALQRWQCRWHPQLKRHIAPSGVPLWRLLRQVPPEELEVVVGQWLAAQVTGVEAVAMDGKTVRGAKGEGVRCNCWRRWPTTKGWCSISARWRISRTRSRWRGRSSRSCT